MNKIKLELLSPARDLKTAQAAILAGADAVYIGGPAFGARVAANNSLDDLKELVNFAHVMGVRVHLTLNTLFYDEEIPKVEAYLNEIKDLGIDVLIVQDPAIFSLNIPKGIEIHASTQCLINSIERLKFYEQLGVAQAVLPREMSVSEIADFHTACPNIRLEAFVAGALCVSESGNCFISEFMTKRSANRGACAQICRLPMELFLDNNLLAKGHLLSLKDNLASSELLPLIKAGVTSFKIEGRLKDLDYVINQTAYFRQKIDAIIDSSCGLYEKSSKGKIEFSFIPDVKKTFNRDFTCAFLQGNNDKVVRDSTPKFLGPKVGVVQGIQKNKDLTKVKVKRFNNIEFNNGDGFTYLEKGEVKGFRVNKASENILEVKGFLNIAQGTTLYRNVDSAFLKEILSKNAVKRSFSYEMKLKVKKGSLTLSIKDEMQREAIKTFDYNHVMDFVTYSKDRILGVLEKKLIPEAYPDKIEIEGDLADLTLPLGQLNQIRREVLQSCFHKRYVREDEKPFCLKENLPRWPEKKVDARLCLNKKALDFYKNSGTEVVLDKQNEVLMTCRHCLVKTYGKCIKEGGKKGNYKLKIGKDIFSIKCDCKKCRMKIIK